MKRLIYTVSTALCALVISCTPKEDLGTAVATPQPFTVKLSMASPEATRSSASSQQISIIPMDNESGAYLTVETKESISSPKILTKDTYENYNPLPDDIQEVGIHFLTYDMTIRNNGVVYDINTLLNNRPASRQPDGITWKAEDNVYYPDGAYRGRVYVYYPRLELNTSAFENNLRMVARLRQDGSMDPDYDLFYVYKMPGTRDEDAKTHTVVDADFSGFVEPIIGYTSLYSHEDVFLQMEHALPRLIFKIAASNAEFKVKRIILNRTVVEPIEEYADMDLWSMNFSSDHPRYDLIYDKEVVVSEIRPEWIGCYDHWNDLVPKVDIGSLVMVPNSVQNGYCDEYGNWIYAPNLEVVLEKDGEEKSFVAGISSGLYRNSETTITIYIPDWEIKKPEEPEETPEENGEK